MNWEICTYNEPNNLKNIFYIPAIIVIERGKPESLFGPETGEAEAVHAEHQELFSKLGAKVETDIHKCIRSFYKKLLSDAENPLTSIDELSERAQNFYQILTSRLDEEICYQGNYNNFIIDIGIDINKHYNDFLKHILIILYLFWCTLLAKYIVSDYYIKLQIDISNIT